MFFFCRITLFVSIFPLCLQANYDDILNEYSEINVDDRMFGDKSNWDIATEFMFDGVHFTKKCKRFIGINWCYCKSEDMALPIPCIGMKHVKKIENKKGKKGKYLATHNAFKRKYNGYSQYDDSNQIQQQNIDRSYFENDANWNFITDSSSYGTQENMKMLHGDLYHVTKKCKQMNGLWNCYCQGLDKVVFACNTNEYEIGIHRNFHCKLIIQLKYYTFCAVLFQI